MREILFRGKPIPEFEHFKVFRPELFTGEFIHGSLVICEDRYYICTHAMTSIRSCVNNGTTTMIEVIPETVGQFTGKLDRNGKKIFEGDIVRAMMDYGPAGLIGSVVNIKFTENDGWQWGYFELDTIEVIGTVYDDPILLDKALMEEE